MDRITVLDDVLWPSVPSEVIEEAKKAATNHACWIAKREDGHFVSLEGPPGGPDVAIGDLIFVAEVAPSRSS